MELYLLRHGIAEDAAPGMRDADRALTSKGRRKLQVVLEHARDAGVAPALVLSSPLRRARETAEMAVEILGCPEPIVEIEALVPESNPERVWAEIRVHRDAPSILLAGHEPLFSALYAFLLNSPGLAVDVKKGSLGRIDVDPSSPRPRGVLRWLVTPGLYAS